MRQVDVCTITLCHLSTCNGTIFRIPTPRPHVHHASHIISRLPYTLSSSYLRGGHVFRPNILPCLPSQCVRAIECQLVVPSSFVTSVSSSDCIRSFLPYQCISNERTRNPTCERAKISRAKGPEFFITLRCIRSQIESDRLPSYERP